MTVLALIAATYTFTATATGVAKGAPVEFLCVGADSDRDYESMFVLDQPVDALCRGLESAGLPRGKPEDVRTCTLWPVGCTVEFKPPLSDFVSTSLGNDRSLASIVYTGGTRRKEGLLEAATNMPLAVFSLYSLSQSPFVFARHYDQSEVYNCHQAAKTLKKGEMVSFTVSWDDKTMPKPLSRVVRPGSSAELIKELKEASQTAELDVRIDFAPDLTVREAVAVANALAVVDSPRVKINGCADGHLFYRAFLPAIKWLDRQERMVQPFELTVGPTNRLVYIESDWSGEGLDPKLTPHEISFCDAQKKQDTDTCFIFAKPTEKLSAIYNAMSLLTGTSVRTWYLFVQE